MDNNTDRIIGDFCEINGDLVYLRNTSIEPKFISNYKYRKNHKRLIKSVEKLRNSKHILTKNNLIELFAYCYNSYPPYGQYKSIKLSKILDEDANNYESVVQFDNFVAIFNLSKKTTNFEIHLTIDNDDDTKDSFTVELKELKTNNQKFINYIEIINSKLLSDMCDFIIDILSAYII